MRKRLELKWKEFQGDMAEVLWPIKNTANLCIPPLEMILLRSGLIWPDLGSGIRWIKDHRLISKFGTAVSHKAVSYLKYQNQITTYKIHVY